MLKSKRGSIYVDLLSPSTLSSILEMGLPSKELHLTILFVGYSYFDEVHLQILLLMVSRFLHVLAGPIWQSQY